MGPPAGEPNVNSDLINPNQFVKCGANVAGIPSRLPVEVVTSERTSSGVIQHDNTKNCVVQHSVNNLAMRPRAYSQTTQTSLKGAANYSISSHHWNSADPMLHVKIRNPNIWVNSAKLKTPKKPIPVPYHTIMVAGVPEETSPTLTQEKLGSSIPTPSRNRTLSSPPAIAAPIRRPDSPGSARSPVLVSGESKLGEESVRAEEAAWNPNMANGVVSPLLWSALTFSASDRFDKWAKPRSCHF